MHTQRTFAPEGQSVPQARRFVRQTLREWGAEDLTDEAVLATSELVTNAVVHAGTPVRVGLEVDAQGLRLEVQDLHPHRALPLGVERPSDDSEHGRGLLITAALAGAWGVDYSAGAKRVWLRMEREHRDGAAAARVGARPTEVTGPGVAVVELSADAEIRSWNADATRMFGWTADEVLGRTWRELAQPLDRGAATGTRPDVPSWADQRWQGVCTVHHRSGTTTEAFASRIARDAGEGSVVLLVPVELRPLLEWPAPRAQAAPENHDPLGLREDALDRLGFEAYLDLVVERSRDSVGAQAAYLLLARESGAGFQVAAVSGLPAAVRGTRLEPGAPGTPDVRNPRLPVVLVDLAPDKAGWLRDTGSRSLLVEPVVAEGRAIGALGLVSERPGGFSDEETVLLQRVAAGVAVAVDRARLRESERERRGLLTFLAEAGTLLAGSLDEEMTMAITGQIVVPQLATWCGVYLHDRRGLPVLKQVWHRDERAGARLRAALEQTSPDQVADSRDEVLSGPVHCIPLMARGRTIGELVLGRHEREPLRGEALVVAEAVARRAALAIDNAHAHGELQAMGEALQRSLLPASVPTAPTFDVGVVYQAAGELSLVGGDFYDIFPVDGGRWCFVVGDVCGSGPEAAAVTGLARHTIRALTLAGFPVASVLERLNQAIMQEGERSRFLTLVCGTLEPARAGGLRLSMVSAGHPLPLLVRPSGQITQVGRPQSLLGVVENVAFVADECLLERGDLLVTVTDGVLERRDGDRVLDEEGLRAELAGVRDLPARAVAERIQRLVVDFAAEPPVDDMAVLALRVPGGAFPANLRADRDELGESAG